MEGADLNTVRGHKGQAITLIDQAFGGGGSDPKTNKQRLLR